MIALAVVSATAVGVAAVVPGKALPPGRYAALDGLRGVLALMVVAHHLLIMRGFTATGRWRAPPANFDHLLGKASVALFFMLSAYLFCGAVIRRKGKIAEPGTRAKLLALKLPAPLGAAFLYVVSIGVFLIGRARRILPGYWLAVGVMVFVVLAETGFALREPLGDVLAEIGWWLPPGWWAADINRHVHSWTIFSVAWSLQIECLFYLAVPLLAIAARYGGAYAPAIVLAVFGYWFDYWFLFAVGALAVPVSQWRFRGTHWAWGWLALAGIIALVMTQRDVAGWKAALLLLPVFVGVARGGLGFRWLGWAPLVRLGRASYSLYLLHNPVLYMVVIWGVGAGKLDALGRPGLIGVCVGATMLAVLASFAAERWVERPLLARTDTGGAARAAAVETGALDGAHGLTLQDCSDSALATSTTDKATSIVPTIRRM